MPNAEGRAAKRAPAKKTTAPAATPDAEPKTERHVRSPLERAQAVYDKAKAASDKVTARLTAAKAEIAELEAEAAEAKVTLDWAASHPLLVKARKDAEATAPDDAGEDQGEAADIAAASGATVDWDIDNNVPASDPASPMNPANSVDEAPKFADGSEIVSSVPAGEGEDDTDDDAGEDSVPPFDFDAAAVPAQPSTPFDFEKTEGSQTTTYV